MDVEPVDGAEGVDVPPAGDSATASVDERRTRRRLLALAREAEALQGADDLKMQEACRLIAQLLDDGYSPIVFCRFIPTVEYLASELPSRLKRSVVVGAISGLAAPKEREDRARQLAEAPQRVLVCTDCLSEGINLQEGFDSVVHYDLSWNPTRHEQRAVSVFVPAIDPSALTAR